MILTMIYKYFNPIDIFMITAIIYLIIYMYITYCNSMKNITLSHDITNINKPY